MNCQTISLYYFFGVKGASYYVAIATVIFSGEGKRRNEFAEWHVAWLAESHNYAEFNIRRSFSKK